MPRYFLSCGQCSGTRQPLDNTCTCIILKYCFDTGYNFIKVSQSTTILVWYCATVLASVSTQNKLTTFADNPLVTVAHNSQMITHIYKFVAIADSTGGCTPVLPLWCSSYSPQNWNPPLLQGTLKYWILSWILWHTAKVHNPIAHPIHP